MIPLVLHVSRRTPSLNDWTGRPRYVYATLKKQWCRYLSDAWFEAKSRRDPGVMTWPLPPRERVALHVDRFTPSGDTLDWDNAHGGLKPAIDALRHLRLIRDDTAGLLTITLAQPQTPEGAPRYWSRFTLTRE